MKIFQAAAIRGFAAAAMFAAMDILSFAKDWDGGGGHGGGHCEDWCFHGAPGPVVGTGLPAVIAIGAVLFMAYRLRRKAS